MIHLTPPDPQHVNEYEHTPAQYKQSLELAAVHGLSTKGYTLERFHVIALVLDNIVPYLPPWTIA